jgi:hypothetical protein
MARKKTAPDDKQPQTIKIEDAKQAELLSDNAVHFVECAAEALVAIEAMEIKKKSLENFWLSPAQRGLLPA